MPDKQLNVWIPEELRNYVAQRAEQERHGMNTVIADLIREDMARRNGQLAEQSSLVVFREIVASELQKSSAQLRRDLREDREYEAESQLEWFKKQFDRLAGLMVMAVRNGGIARRLTYSMLSKTHGANFAVKPPYPVVEHKAPLRRRTRGLSDVSLGLLGSSNGLVGERPLRLGMGKGGGATL